MQKSQVFFESVATQVIWCESSKVLTPPASSAATASSPRSKSMLCIYVFVFVFVFSVVFVSVFVMTLSPILSMSLQVHSQEYVQKGRELFVKTWISNNHGQRPSSSWSKSSNTTLYIFQNYMRQNKDNSATTVHKIKKCTKYSYFYSR